MIITETCTFPLHPLPEKLGQKNKFAFLLPQTKGHVRWCKACKALQEERLAHIMAHNGYYWEEEQAKKFEAIINKRFGGNMHKLSRYANQHARKGEFWCHIGWHYITAKQRSSHYNRCRYCSKAHLENSWRRYAGLKYSLKRKRQLNKEMDETIRLKRRYIKELNNDIERLRRIRLQEEAAHGRVLRAV